MIKKREKLNIKAVLALLCVILLIAGAAYLIFYKMQCTNQSCFMNSLWKCKSITFLDTRENSTWYYIVKGPNNDGCDVYVKPISLKTDVETASLLIGKDMICNIPRDISGSFLPETRIEYCHGMLKEGMQDLIIKKLHLFIVQNIGQINQTASPL